MDAANDAESIIRLAAFVVPIRDGSGSDAERGASFSDDVEEDDDKALFLERGRGEIFLAHAESGVVTNDDEGESKRVALNFE